MYHLIDFKSENLQVIQPYDEKALKKNMSTLFAVLVHLLFAAANCLACCERLSDSLEDCLNTFTGKGQKG